MDEQYILDLFNQLGGESKFGKFNDFKQLITTDQSYQKDFYNSFGANTLGDFNDFRGLVSSTQPAQQQPVQQPPAKKKEPTVSSSEGGWSDWYKPKQEYKPTTPIPGTDYTVPEKGPILSEQGEDVWTTKVQQNREDREREKKLKELKKYENYQPEYITDEFGNRVKAMQPIAREEYLTQPLQKIEQKVKYEEEAKKIQEAAPEEIKSTLKYLDLSKNKSLPNFVSDANYYFNDAGFEFKDVGSNYIEITSPDGEVEQFKYHFGSKEDIENTIGSINSTILKKSAKLKDIYGLDRMYKDENKKFATQYQIDSEFSMLAKEQEALVQQTNTFLKRKQEAEAALKAVNELPMDKRTANYRNDKFQAEQNLKAIYTEAEELQKKIDAIPIKQKNLERALGKYTSKQEKQGTWVGGIYNSLLSFLDNTVAGSTDIFIDLKTGFIPVKTQLGAEEYEKRVKLYAAELGIDANKVLLPEEYMSKLTDPEKRGAVLDAKVLKEKIDAKIRDDIRKKEKYGTEDELTFMEAMRNGFKTAFGDKNTTEQWEALTKKSFVGGAVLGAAEFVPTMFVPGAWVRRAATYASVNDMVNQEFENNPELRDVSEAEKLYVKIPIGIVGAVLEEYGLKNIIQNTALVKSITGRTLLKATEGMTPAAFKKLVSSEVSEMIADGTLKVLGGGIMEFETGAAQQGVDIAVKSIYNASKGKKLFDTPDTVVEVAVDMAVAGAQESIGSVAISTPMVVASAYRKKDIAGIPAEFFDIFVESANDQNVERGFIATLKNDITAGKITQKDAVDLLNNYRNSVGLLRSVPPELDNADKKKAMTLLRERKELESKTDGKDPALVKPIQNRINQINEQLSKLTEDAIQKQTTSEVSVQPEAGAGQEVEIGGPEAKPKITPEESKRKEDLLAALEATDKDVIAIGDELLDRKEAQAELEAITQKEQAAVTEQGGMEQAESVQADEETRKQALRDLMQATGDDIFILGTEDGTFAGDGLLNMNENGDVVLTRFADSAEGLVKSGKITSPENLKNLINNFGGEQIPTSAIEGGMVAYQAAGGNVVGEYHIPLQDLIQLIKDGYIVFAGLGNKEFVLSPHIADKYLTKVNGKNVKKEQATTEQVGTEQKTTQETFEQKKSEIEKITDPEQRKVAEIEFIMSNLASGVGEASANKIREYADRIISGKETRDQVIQGLPKSFVDGIDQLLAAQQAPAVTPTATTTATEVTPTEQQFTEQDRARKAELEEAMRKADKRRKNITVGETTMPKAEAKAELDALVQKEQAAQQPVTPAVVEVAPTEVAPTETRTAEQEADLLEELLTGKKKEPTVTEVKAEPTSKEAIAKRLRGKKSKGLMSSIDFGISQALYNGALEFMATQVEKGTKLGNAIENTIKWIDEKMQGKSWDKDGFTKYANTTFEEVATKKKAKAILDVYPKGSVVGIADLASESGDTIISNVLSKMKDVFNKVKISGRRPTEGAAFYNYNTKEIDVNKNSPHWDEVEGDQIASALSHEFAHHLIDGHSEKEAIETDLQEIKDDLIANKPELTESQKKAYEFMTSKNNSPQEILTYAVSDPDIRPILTKYKDKLNNISNKLFGEDVISGIFEEQKTKKDEIQPQRTRDGRGRTESRAIAPLEGAPSVPGFSGPDPQLTAVAEEYAKENGIPYKRQGEYVKVDEGRAKRIAQAYEEMKHDPQNPKVKEAYENLIKQTIAQYEALVKAGYKFWFIDTNIPSNLEYAQSPFNAMRDVRSNKQMGVFPTTDGFGSSDIDVSDNPMMAETKFKWPVGGMDGELKPVLANDLFRAVHDAFGHGLEGAGFRARGEENAWQAHIRLFTGSAVGAITSETRGQNSWLNFGPHGEKNRAANTDETIFADQKTGLMPEWTWKEGVAADMETTAKPFATSLADAIVKNLTIKAGGLQSNILGIPIAIWNSGVKTMAAAVRAGAAINEAVQKAIEHIREKHGKKFNEAAAEKKLLIGQYKGAIEVAREAKVTDDGLKAYFKRQGLTDAQIEALLTFKEKAEKKPISKEKVIGKPKSKKVTVNEMTALKDQLRLEAKAAREAKGDLNAKRKMLTASIKEMEKKGSISARQAKALINRVNAVNLDNPVMVERLLDYAEKVFNDAAYAEKLSQAKKLQSTAKSLSKNKEKNPEVRELAKKFAEIDPALVENIDEYIEMASAVVEGVKGSKLTTKGVSLAAAVDINETSKYIEKALEQQAEKQKQMMADKMQSLMGVDVSDLTYDQLLELLDDSSKPIDKYKETIIRDIINKMFDTYSGIIESMLETGKDPFDISEDAETIEFKDSTKQVVRNFMSIDLNSLSPREALKAVDALNNFIVNGSTANMETVYNTYLANENASTVKKKGVKGKKLTFFFVPSLGRMLLDEFASLPLLLESMFKSTNVALYFSRMSGLSNLMNGAARATTITQKTIARYLDAFSKLKPNGKAFNDAYNATERGMVAFMSRNLIGSEAKMKKEFNDRKSLVEKSIEELSKGTAKEQEKAKLYQEAYDKILDGSENAQQVKDKAAKENVEAVDWWINEWSKHFDELSDVSLNVYNKVLDRDLNYTTDRYSKLDLAAKDESVLDSNASAYHFNNGTMYKKEAGALKETTDKTGELPKNKDGEVTRYVDLSFDSIQASSLYDAMADIKTAGAIRQVDAFFKSKDTRSLFSAEDFKLLDERVKLAIRNIRNQQAFNNGEIEKLVKALDKFAKYSASIALAGVTQPFKQTIPLMFNTLINAGQFDPFGVTFNKDIKNFIDESGRAIANRGVESQVYIESINRLIDEAAKSKGEAALKLIEQANDLWMKVFLANPDRYIARASWMAYYEQSLKKQGINTKGIDYASHELNDEAADYAQMMVDRQQNITDTKLAGRMYSDTEGGWGKKVLTRMLLPLASFRLNQFIRAKSDTATLFSKTTTLQDKKKAARSLSGMAAEMLVFKSMVIGFGLTWHYISDAILAAITGDEEDEEESEKKWKVRFNNLVKGQATSTVTDLFSPIPILDPFVKYGANTALDVTQDLLKVADDDKFKLFVDDLKSPKTYASSAGMYGIGLDKINEIFKTSNLAITGKFIDDRGHERFIRDEQRSLLSWLLIPSVVFNAGLLPGAPEFNNITGKITKDIKYSGMTEKQMDVYKKTGLDKDEIKRSKEKAFKGYSSEKQFEENDPEGYLKAVEDGTIYDYRKQQQDIRIATEEMSPEQLYKVNPTLWKKKYGPGTDYYKQQRTPAARKKAREEQRYKAELKAKKEVIEAKRQREEARKKRRY